MAKGQAYTAAYKARRRIENAEANLATALRRGNEDEIREAERRLQNVEARGYKSIRDWERQVDWDRRSFRALPLKDEYDGSLNYRVYSNLMNTDDKFSFWHGYVDTKQQRIYANGFDLGVYKNRVTEINIPEWNKRHSLSIDEENINLFKNASDKQISELRSHIRNSFIDKKTATIHIDPNVTNTSYYNFIKSRLEYRLAEARDVILNKQKPYQYRKNR